ncbi:MAG: hypothetical protein V4532_03125 [Pseudomonadota bacterium]
MTDQLQEAIRITKFRIDELENELKRERDFMARLIPAEIRETKRKVTNQPKWVEVFSAIETKPMKHEHIIDFIEEHEPCAYFSDRGRLFQADRGRRFSAIVDAQRVRASGDSNVSQSSTISLK